MGFHVSKKPVLAVGLSLLCAFGLSSLGFSRSVDWDENALQGATFARMFGPQLPKPVSSDQGRVPIWEVRNYEIAEAQFSYVQGIDISGVGETLDQTNAQKIEKIEIDDTVLRLAYAQYLVSLLAAEDALGVEQGEMPIRQIESATAAALSVQIEDPVEMTLAQTDIPNENVLPVFIDLIPPIPHERGQLVAVVNDENVENVEQFVSVPVENLFPASERFAVAPMPVSANLRPVMVVHPQSVAIVQPARDVSLDRLVHVQAQGSWPRRLDQINSADNDNIFMRNWGRNGPKNGSSLSRLPNGFILVTANK